MMAKALVFHLSPNLGVPVEEFLKWHVGWFVLQPEPMDHLVAKVGTLGNGLQVVPDTGSKPLVIFRAVAVLHETVVPLGDCNYL